MSFFGKRAVYSLYRTLRPQTIASTIRPVSKKVWKFSFFLGPVPPWPRLPRLLPRLSRLPRLPRLPLSGRRVCDSMYFKLRTYPPLGVLPSSRAGSRKWCKCPERERASVDTSAAQESASFTSAGRCKALMWLCERARARALPMARCDERAAGVWAPSLCFLPIRACRVVSTLLTARISSPHPWAPRGLPQILVSHEDYTCYGSHRATHVPSTRESRRTAGRPSHARDTRDSTARSITYSSMRITKLL